MYNLFFVLFCFNLVFAFTYLEHLLPEIKLSFTVLINAIMNFIKMFYYQNAILLFSGCRSMNQKFVGIRKYQDRKWHNRI